jgi:hypothetical protein
VHLQVNPTGRFAVIDLANLKIDHVAASESGHAGREKTRLTKGTGQSIEAGSGKIGGAFTVTPNPPYLAERIKIYERIKAKQIEDLSGEQGSESPSLSRIATFFMRTICLPPCRNLQASPRTPSRSLCQMVVSRRVSLGRPAPTILLPGLPKVWQTVLW